MTAGVGQFNASLVDPSMALYEGAVSYGVLALAFDLVGNPELSIELDPVNCTTDQCESYLFPGSLETITPWAPTEHADAPVVQIDSSPASQMEFRKGIANGDGFLASDCTVYGSEDVPVGVSFCLAQSQVLPGSYIAGMLHTPPPFSFEWCHEMVNRILLQLRFFRILTHISYLL